MCPAGNLPCSEAAQLLRDDLRAGAGFANGNEGKISGFWRLLFGEGFLQTSKESLQ